MLAKIKCEVLISFLQIWHSTVSWQDWIKLLRDIFRKDSYHHFLDNFDFFIALLGCIFIHLVKAMDPSILLLTSKSLILT